MDKNQLEPIYRRFADRSSEDKRKRMLSEIEAGGDHGLPAADPKPVPGLYGPANNDQSRFLNMRPEPDKSLNIRSIDDLLAHDKQRTNDGFPEKIRIGRLVKPGRSGQRVIVVPTTTEEKFIHDPEVSEEEEGAGGQGKGEEGEIIGEQPIDQSEQGSGAGPGQGEETNHGIEQSAYELGRVLTEKFSLPHLQEKSKKRPSTRIKYDLTDRNRGFGQFLDKKASLRKIIETNISLGNIDPENVDTEQLIVSPKDMIYRILSREKVFESPAMIFFVRDYSGSMTGKRTQIIVSQHVMIYAFLLYQYEHMAECRFILHDTSAKEVPDFFTYYNSKVAGGTQVSSGYKLVNEIAEKENLAQEYNIYVFHGTDGDDWDAEGKDAVPELKKMMSYVNRVGITVVNGNGDGSTEVEKYVKKSNLLKEYPKLIRLDSMPENADEPRLIEGIKTILSE